MDLFDLLEKFFRGIVYFIYNVVETTAAIVRQPIHAPLRLFRLHVRANTQQIGGMTFLFLAFMALYWAMLNTLWDGLPGLSALATNLGEASVNAPRLDVNAIWPNLLAALASTIIIDAVLRLVLRWRRPGERRYRQLLLGAGEYALLWMVLAALSTTILCDVLWAHDASAELAEPLAWGWGTVSLVGASYPAAKIVRIWRSPAGRRREPWQTLAGMATLAVLFAMAAFVGLTLASDVHGRRAWNEFSDYRTHLRTLRCVVLADGRIDIDGFVYVKDGDPRAMKASEFTLVFESIYGEPIGDPFGLELVWRAPRTNPYVVVSENQPLVLELRTPKAVDIPDEAGCRLDGWWVKTEDQGIGFERPNAAAPVDDGLH